MREQLIDVREVQATRGVFGAWGRLSIQFIFSSDLQTEGCDRYRHLQFGKPTKSCNSKLQTQVDWFLQASQAAVNLLHVKQTIKYIHSITGPNSNHDAWNCEREHFPGPDRTTS